jgi:hypothetical protein
MTDPIAALISFCRGSDTAFLFCNGSQVFLQVLDQE